MDLICDHKPVSRHYCRRTNYRVQTLKTTALVDIASQDVLDVHRTTELRHDTQIGWQLTRRNAGEIASLAADKGYGWQQLREKSRNIDVRPLIKHSEFRPNDCAYNARIDGSLYDQQALSETVFSSIKSTLGHAVCAERDTANFVRSPDVYGLQHQTSGDTVNRTASGDPSKLLVLTRPCAYILLIIFENYQFALGFFVV